MSKFRTITIVPTTVPTSPKDGQIYHDSTLNQLRVHIDGVWHSLGSGAPGTNGKQIELQKNSTHVQWRYVGDQDWINLVLLSEITGPAGSSPIINALTIGNGLSGTSYDGTSAVTISLDSSKYAEMDYSIRVTMGSTTLSGINGMTSSTTGTIALNNFSSASTIGRIPHVTLTSTSTAGASTGMRSTVSYFSISGGFRYKTIFMINDASTVSGSRHFCGMSSSSLAPSINSSTNSNPFSTSLTNYFAFGYDGANGDTKLYLFHNSSTAGNTTKVTLNNTYSVAADADVYCVEFFNEPNSNIVNYSIRGLLSNTGEKGTITTNLPLSSLLYGHVLRTNGTSGAVVKLEQSSIQLFSYG